ncbi:20153_t:CDS:2 [Gigaspora margarita]|uniref:20153_t:CDS:1 n=1 Tax=Gigaspora margarita TaxID=4874 RepID=A0ABN7UAB4_GIGMA|nr:20153_t:CDS:2 [Gigaspora margarita]
MITKQPTITTCFCKKYHTYFATKTLTAHSNLQTASSTPKVGSSSGMEIDFNINIYNNLPKVEKSPYQPRNNITQPFSTSFDNTSRSNLTQYKAHSQHAHTCIICKIKNIPCIILQNKKHSLDLNALILKNQQLDFPAHPQYLHQLKLKPIQQQTPLSQKQQNIFHFLKFMSLNKEQKKQLLLRTYNKAFVKKYTKRKKNDQDKPQKNSIHQSNPASDGQTQQETHQNEEPKPKTSKYKEKDAPKTPHSTTTGHLDFSGLKTESFNPNQPNTATFSKPTPITQLRKLTTRTAKKFAEENQVTETTECHTNYFYCYLKAYLKATANNDSIKEMDCNRALQHVTNSDTNPHTLARIIAFYDIQSQFRISIKNIKEKYSTDYLSQAEEFIINYYKIAIPDANDYALFFFPNSKNYTEENNSPF